MKKLLITILTITPILLYGQDYRTRYENLYSESKFEEIAQLLIDWEEAEPENPEMFIANFNYFLQKSQQEIMQMDTKPSQGQNLTISDTATGEPVGYLYGKIHYDDDLFNKAQKYLVDGIRLNPNRLDMHFGRIYSLRERGYLEEHVDEIIKVIKKHTQEHPKWLWSNNEQIENSENMFKGSIQDYNYALFNIETPYIKGVKTISQEMMKHYPNDIENYSNIGVCYLMESDWQEALNLFNKALEINSGDPIVLSNIAYSYRMLGKLKESINYYEKVLKIVGDEEGDYAKQQIKYLKAELKK